MRMLAAMLFCFVTLPLAAQEIEVDISACRGMGEVLKAMHDGAPRDRVAKRLDELLATRPYRVMFAHYNRSWRPNHLPPSVFKRMILSLRFEGEYKSGENERADTMRTRWQMMLEDPSRYERKLRQLEAADLPKLIREGVAYARGWLPPDWEIPGFYFPVVPNGGSPAFTIDGAQGYDFLQLAEDAGGRIDLHWLIGTISHESHHLGMRSTIPDGLDERERIAFQVVNLAIAEGSATKFISGPPAGCVPILAEAPFSNFTPELTKAWNAHVAREDEIVRHQAALLERALAGELSEEALRNELRDYWLNGSVGRAYVIGAEMFGAIYFAHGKEGVFAAMKDPRRLFALYNEALDEKPELLGRCPRVPEKAVKQALRISPLH